MVGGEFGGEGEGSQRNRVGRGRGDVIGFTVGSMFVCFFKGIVTQHSIFNYGFIPATALPFRVTIEHHQVCFSDF